MKLGERFFVLPQAPGAGIRPLGFPRISSGAQSRLPPLRVGWLTSRPAPIRRIASARPTGRRALWRVAKATDVVARRLRLYKKLPRPALEV